LFSLFLGLLIGRGRIVKFCGIFKDKFTDKTADFVGNLWEFSGQISLRNDRQKMAADFVGIFWANFAGKQSALHCFDEHF